MSVIVWDGKTLAADRQVTCAGMRSATSKMRRLDDGTILAATGDLEVGLLLFRWFVNGLKEEEWPEAQSDKKRWSRLIAVSPDGSVVFYEQEPIGQKVLDPFMAWGAGRDYAMGAMAMGADARKAVEVANRFCIDCGMGVEAYDLEPVELKHTAEPNCECDNPACGQCRAYRNYMVLVNNRS